MESSNLTHFDVPHDVLLIIFQYAASSARNVFKLALVCGQWSSMLLDVQKESDCYSLTNRIWKRIALTRWDLSHDMNISNWFKLCKRRIIFIRSTRKQKNNFIDNCEDIEMKCPMTWEKILSPMTDRTKQLCRVCNQFVYHCSTREEVLQHKELGHCVSFFIAPKIEEYTNVRIG
jgi:hypothetical protein